MIIKQSVVDVLMFLFEQYLGDDNTVLDERDDMHNRLEEMGFEHLEINQAFDWLEDLALLQGESEICTPCREDSVRIFSDEEKTLLNEDCCGFLIYLEQTGILTPVTREVVLDRVIALNHELDIEQLKWIAMIILHTHPGEENAFAWMESLVFDEVVDYMQ
jgi:Smg protein